MRMATHHRWIYRENLCKAIRNVWVVVVLTKNYCTDESVWIIIIWVEATKNKWMRIEEKLESFMHVY